MKPLNSNMFRLILIAMFSLVVSIPSVFADGSETLGPVSIGIDPGTSIVVAGTGMSQNNSGEIEVDLPLGADMKQVLLYWQGFTDGNGPTSDQNKITVNGTPITAGLPIGMVVDKSYCYREDITDITVVNSGAIKIMVEDMGFNGVNNGAGILVIFDDGSDLAAIDIRDGYDYAWIGAALPVKQETVPQTFTFSPAPFDRTANLSMLFSAVAGTASTGGFRPTIIRITVGGVITIESNLLDSNDGEELDSVNLLVDIPAGATEMTVQSFSEGINPPEPGKEGEPASFVWIAAGFSIVPPPPEGGEGCTPGYWKQEHHFGAWKSYTPDMPFSAVFEDAFPGMTLLEVLKQGGGGLKALGRHSVAALLNASSCNTKYDLTVPEVIDLFNDLHPGSKSGYNSLKDFFQGFNEQGCPLGNNFEGSNEQDCTYGNNLEQVEASGDNSRASLGIGSSDNGSSSCFISTLKH
jgi:hypothetical protein